ncbi:hypothetical protein B4U80_07497 [Leptotrombidium deliense]|uniref:non-specific serine/threonine protein kinase n=1 Tax=Leptotrombidium deliense TaxID=299467 RepID=A0A443SHI0_9ACAR|nr:hypothetical protein B4U80_07497 [Leptotrombidium deliense]
MEFVGFKSLHDYLEDNSCTLNACVRTNFCSQILSALNYCHQKQIIHLDLKPSNIVVTADNVCKIIDFGCSRGIDGIENSAYFENFESYTLGTVRYMAPELFKNSKPTTKCDIYSFGIIMWQLVCRTIPYSNIESPEIIIYKVVAENLRPTFSNEAMLNFNKYCELAQCCWNKSPSERPSAQHLLLKLSE